MSQMLLLVVYGGGNHVYAIPGAQNPVVSEIFSLAVI